MHSYEIVSPENPVESAISHETIESASRYLIGFAAFTTGCNVHPHLEAGFGDVSAKPRQIFRSSSK
jgi:hypothetical protein